MAKRPVQRGNKYAAPCKICGQTVEPGKGIWSPAMGVKHKPTEWYGSPTSGRWVGGCPKEEMT